MAELDQVQTGMDSDALVMFIPFSKVKDTPEGGLIIEGVATAELEDLQGDVVDYQASKAAFSAAAPVNIREQHDPHQAVGIELSHTFDDANREVLLRALISSGAPTTIQKIKDKVLRGFSIGGAAKEKAMETVESAGAAPRERRRILKYDLSELSVCDRPALPQATFSLAKSVDGVLTPAEDVAFSDFDDTLAKTQGLVLDPAVVGASMGNRLAELTFEKGLEAVASEKPTEETETQKGAAVVVTDEAIRPVITHFDRADFLRKRALGRGLLPVGKHLIVCTKKLDETEDQTFAKAQTDGTMAESGAELFGAEDIALVSFTLEKDHDPEEIAAGLDLACTAIAKGHSLKQIAAKLAELDDEDEEGEGDEEDGEGEGEELVEMALTGDDLQKVVSEAVKSETEPLLKRIAELEKRPKPRPEDLEIVEPTALNKAAETDENEPLYKAVTGKDEASYEDAMEAMIQKLNTPGYTLTPADNAHLMKLQDIAAHKRIVKGVISQ